MKSRFLACASAFAVACVLASASSAADLSLSPLYKAPRAFSSDVYNDSGWFLTVLTSADVAQSSVSGNNLFASSLASGGLVSDGAGIGGGFGYISYGGPTGWWMLRSDFTWQNIRGGNNAGSVSSNLSFTQEACIGADFIKMLAGVLPNIGTSFPTFNPVAPAGAVGTPRQCFSVALEEFKMDGSFGAARGETWGIAPGVGMHFLWEAVDPSGKPTGGAWDVSALVTFPTRGATFGNVFAANGTPLTVNGGADLGTNYRAGLAYHFSPVGLRASPPGK